MKRVFSYQKAKTYYNILSNKYINYLSVLKYVNLVRLLLNVKLKLFRDANITFRISAPHCGLVSLVGRPAYPVSQFTMEQIRTGQVLFTHSGQLWL